MGWGAEEEVTGGHLATASSQNANFCGGEDGSGGKWKVAVELGLLSCKEGAGRV